MLEGFVDSLYGMGGVSGLVLGVVGVVLGLLECFAGYRIFRVQVGIVGFLAGLLIGITAVVQTTDVAGLAIAAGLLMGVLLCVLSMKIYKAGVFLLVAFFASVVAAPLVQNGWAVLVIAVLTGTLGVFLTPHVLIVVTALGGARIVANVIPQLIPRAKEIGWLGTVIVIVLGICGIAAQYRTKGEVERK